jgi:subtilase family serine protease
MTRRSVTVEVHRVGRILVPAGERDGRTVGLPNLAPGAYYLLMMTDGATEVAESDETNNVIATAITIVP